MQTQPGPWASPTTPPSRPWWRRPIPIPAAGMVLIFLVLLGVGAASAGGTPQPKTVTKTRVETRTVTKTVPGPTVTVPVPGPARTVVRTPDSCRKALDIAGSIIADGGAGLSSAATIIDAQTQALGMATDALSDPLGVDTGRLSELTVSIQNETATLRDLDAKVTAEKDPYTAAVADCEAGR